MYDINIWLAAIVFFCTIFILVLFHYKCSYFIQTVKTICITPTFCQLMHSLMMTPNLVLLVPCLLNVSLSLKAW